MVLLSASAGYGLTFDQVDGNTDWNRKQLGDVGGGLRPDSFLSGIGDGEANGWDMISQIADGGRWT